MTNERSNEIFNNGATLSTDETVEYLNDLAQRNGLDETVSTRDEIVDILDFALGNFDSVIDYNFDDNTFTIASAR